MIFLAVLCHWNIFQFVEMGNGSVVATNEVTYSDISAFCQLYLCCSFGADFGANTAIKAIIKLRPVDKEYYVSGFVYLSAASYS